MRCGVSWDPYSTVESMTLILASGTVIDTAEPDAESRFAAAEPELARAFSICAQSSCGHRAGGAGGGEVRDQERHRLSPGALLDADTPLEIFRRLVVGSEGTLAFIAEAVMRTRPEPRHRTLAWLHFATIDDAVAHLPELVEAGARATELMVAAALIASAYQMPGTPEYWKELPPGSAR